jgi:hypothetical protein
MRAGPVGTMTIRQSGELPVGKMMGQWFVYSLLIAVLAADETRSDCLILYPQEWLVATQRMSPAAERLVTIRISSTACRITTFCRSLLSDGLDAWWLPDVGRSGAKHVRSLG